MARVYPSAPFWMSLALAYAFPLFGQPVSSGAPQSYRPEREPATVCGERAYAKWRDEDAVYLLSAQERKDLNHLCGSEECQEFIGRFWRVRDPDPKTQINEFKVEHYRRIAYANERFAAAVPGWRTDRGRIYILYGAPSRIESYPSGMSLPRPPEEGGGATSTFPFERWTYDHIPSLGDNIEVEFVDSAGAGDYKLVEVIDARRRPILKGERKER